MSVKAWRELVTIPTYEVGKPEKNPMFLEKRVYQGSSGVVYPYPVIETMSDEKVDKEYQAIWIENEYIKVMVLPELGGRVQMAYDKIAKRHFVYYNHVIKPALVGLLGPWISGGIEFNWPQHHRPTTYMPVDSTIVENKDGSVTVWVNEVERMFYQRAMTGFILRPGCAYLEIQGRVSNRSSLPQTFLWWANPAVEVNDAYQSVFPPDVNAVFDHGKRAVSSFPIATGTYYKMDYSAGVDISNYKNIFVPTSYMAVNSKYDFEGGYENDTKAGMLHVASHHVSPGKKQWTWGNGDFGRAWDRNLTDEVGSDTSPFTSLSSLKSGFRPYIELMAGVYTENQPDFTWLMPFEEKMFTQYFMPYRELGVVKQASKDFVMNIMPIEGDTEKVRLMVYATSRQRVQLVLKNDREEVYLMKDQMLTPEEVFSEVIDVKGTPLQHLRFSILQNSFVCLTWHAEPDEIRPIPNAAVAAKMPKDIKTNDELYHTALHLEQYRHATWNPVDYYEEALRRDPDDVRCLNALGRWYLRKGRFERAEQLLRHAVAVATRFNPNPYDGEPFYNLALALKYMVRHEEAHAMFRKAAWSLGWKDAAMFEAGRISMLLGNYDEAVEELTASRCSMAVALRMEARSHLLAQRYGCPSPAESSDVEVIKADPFDYMARYYIATNSGIDNKKALSEMSELMRNDIRNYHQLAIEYADAGQWDSADAILAMACATGAQPTPMTFYYRGWFASHRSEEKAIDYFKKAENACPDCCFPNRLEDILALECAKTLNPRGAKAPYYLGCLYYAARQYDLAIENWERSVELDPDFPTVWRNLALGRFNKQGRQSEALEYMERAFHLDENDERVLMELDQLYKRLHKPHAERLAFLQKYPELIKRRDDLVLEEATLLNMLGRYEEAKQLIDNRTFHPWEGGEGKVSGQYQMCRLEIAKRNLTPNPSIPSVARLPVAFPKGEGSIKTAIGLLEECLVFPHHLGEGKLYGSQDNDFYYFLGIAYEMQGEKEKANAYFLKGIEGPTEPAAAMYYNDAKPDKIFYAALCYRKLGQEDKARSLFNKLINYGKQHIFEKQIMDYFAVSLPDLLIWEDSLDQKNTIHCKYMLALGYYGMGDKEKSLKYLTEVEALDNNHQGIRQFRTLIDAEY
jgi:tetratricopeptide (TPR) repeat protein